MRLTTVILMIGLLFALPVSAQRMRGRQMASSSFAAGTQQGRGKGTCDGTGPKRDGRGKGCSRGAGQCGRQGQCARP